LHPSFDFGDGMLMPKLAKKSEFDVPAMLDGLSQVVIGSFFFKKPRIFGNNNQTKFSPLPPICFSYIAFYDWTSIVGPRHHC
jgi:hypothetical protein